MHYCKRYSIGKQLKAPKIACLLITLLSIAEVLPQDSSDFDLFESVENSDSGAASSHSKKAPTRVPQPALVPCAPSPTPSVRVFGRPRWGMAKELPDLSVLTRDALNACLVFLTSFHEHRLLHGPAAQALTASHFAAGACGKAIPRSKRRRLRWQYGGHLASGISTRTQDTRASLPKKCSRRLTVD